jgi:hypothetical protein
VFWIVDRAGLGEYLLRRNIEGDRALVSIGVALVCCGVVKLHSQWNFDLMFGIGDLVLGIIVGLRSNSID